METAARLKDKIASLTVANPAPCALAATKLFRTRAGLLKFAYACQYIGWSYSRQIFDQITREQWAALETAFEAARYALAPDAVSAALLDVYMALLAETLAWDPLLGMEDPFRVLDGILGARLKESLEPEDPASLALISFFPGEDRMRRVLEAVPPSIAKQVVVHICRLQRMPEALVAKAATDFAKRLRERLGTANVKGEPRVTFGRPTPPPFHEKSGRVASTGTSISEPRIRRNHPSDESAERIPEELGGVAPNSTQLEARAVQMEGSKQRLNQTLGTLNIKAERDFLQFIQTQSPHLADDLAATGYLDLSEHWFERATRLMGRSQ